jgi:hypothetical protein
MPADESSSPICGSRHHAVIDGAATGLVDGVAADVDERRRTIRRGPLTQSRVADV